MHGELALPVTALYAFLLVLTRITGLFLFLPLPALQSGPDVARIVLSVATTISLFPQWPRLQRVPANVVELLLWLIIELMLGLAIGLGVSFLLEMFLFAAQSVSVQAGFSYASTVDPSTSADSTVLSMAAQLTGGLLFFALGLDGEVLKVLAASLVSRPPGIASLSSENAHVLLTMGATIFTTGLRLSLPLITLLLLVDLSLGLMSRLNGQLQVLALAMPIKMLAAIAVLSWSVLLLPRLFGQSAGSVFGALRGVFGQ